MTLAQNSYKNTKYRNCATTITYSLMNVIICYIICQCLRYKKHIAALLFRHQIQTQAFGGKSNTQFMDQDLICEYNKPECRFYSEILNQ